MLSTPDSTIEVSVTGGERLIISARYKGITVLKPSEIGLKIRQVIHGVFTGNIHPVSPPRPRY